MGGWVTFMSSLCTIARRVRNNNQKCFLGPLWIRHESEVRHEAPCDDLLFEVSRKGEEHTPTWLMSPAGTHQANSACPPCTCRSLWSRSSRSPHRALGTCLHYSISYYYSNLFTKMPLSLHFSLNEGRVPGLLVIDPLCLMQCFPHSRLSISTCQGGGRGNAWAGALNITKHI